MTPTSTPTTEVRPLPKWAETLRQKYLAGEASTFVLYRNVFDSFLVAGKLHSLQSFLVDELFRDTKKRVCEISLERGIRALRDQADGLGATAESVPGGADGTQLLPEIHRLERQMLGGVSTAVIVPYADALLPAGDASFMSYQDRQIYLAFHRWSLDQALTKGDNIVVLITESLNAINPSLLSNPKVAAVEIPMPDQETRREVIAFLAPRLPESHVELFAERTGGLRTVQLTSIMASSEGHGLSEAERLDVIRPLLAGTADAEQRAATLATITAGMTPAEITRLIEPNKVLPDDKPNQDVLQIIHSRKREMIEKECAGLIEFIEPSHGLESVGGHETHQVGTDGDRPDREEWRYDAGANGVIGGGADGIGQNLRHQGLPQGSGTVRRGTEEFPFKVGRFHRSQSGTRAGDRQSNGADRGHH
jgi:transitional endoplasmic reticulum ATPase